MNKAWLLLAGLSMAALSARAQLQYQGGYVPDQSLQEYFAAEDQNYNKSIIYIFYNGDQCYDCPQTIAMTEQIFNQYYTGRYNLFVIDYANDDEYNFIEAYQLRDPLSIVLVRIEDGESLGYQKIPNPQNLIDSPEDYEQYITERINNFLG